MIARRRLLATEIANELLGGARRKQPRARGFVSWTPRAETQAILDQVQSVLDEYEDHLPLTIRQIFYRLVGAHGYEKTQQAYERLLELMSRARRARLIPMESIRDDGSTVMRPSSWESAEDFLESVRWQAGRLTLDRSAGQKTRLAVICEAAGMAPQLAEVANPFGVPVMSSGGFASLTDVYKFATELADQDRATEVLHIGDHDPSGAHLFLAFSEDVRAFARELGGEVALSRLAVTPQQVIRYRLPTAPPKATDNRAFHGRTCQAEALAPDDLADILRTAIEQRIDQRAFDGVLRRERKVRREVLRRLKTTAKERTA